MIHSIPDDSGFLAIINNDKYITYVDEDWTLEQLVNHFQEQMKNHSLLIWNTGNAKIWKVKIKNGISNTKGFRKIVGTINVTNKKLYLLNYESLSMAAQFKDVLLPEEHLKDLIIELEDGFYKINIIQMESPDTYENIFEYDFLIEYELNDEIEASWGKIPWFENYYA